MAGTLFTTDPTKPLEIRLSKDGFGSTPPKTVGQVFRETVKAHGDKHALAYKEDGEWKRITFKEYYSLSLRVAKSFLKLGLQKYGSVIITGFNSVEWVASNYGAIFAGGLSNGIYSTNSADVCQYIALDSNAQIAVVENDMQLQKFLKVRDNLPNLKAIVQYKGKLTQPHPNVYDWEEFLKVGDGTADQVIEDIVSSHTPKDCCSLIYTSGTTGDPKGVMLSHDNMTFTAKTLSDTHAGAFVPGEYIVSYLPLSHIAGQMADMYSPLAEGLCCHFAQPDALKGTLGETLREVQPHFFFGVPRVWEKFMAGIQKMLPPPGSGPPPTPDVMKAIVQKVRAGLGLSRAKFLGTGAAPLDIATLSFFAKFGMVITNIWGMSEGSGPGTTSTKFGRDTYKIGTVGKPYLGVELRLDSVDSTTGDGEVCFRGRTLMMGYINKPEKTREAIDDEGWMHSGDLGRLDEDGFLTITGRIKELIITSGGENIAPVPIEARIKKHAPFLSNVTLIGDKRKFVSCLVTIKCTMDINTGCPLDTISEETLPVLATLGSTATLVSEVIASRDPAVYKAIEESIEKANKEAISSAQKVQKFVILKQDFSVPGGELGPTLKLKRFVVTSKYSREVDSMYTE